MMPFTLREIAEAVGGTVIGDETLKITGVAKIEEAGEGTLTFLANPKYAKFVSESGASAFIVSPDIVKIEGRTYVEAANPYYAFMKAVTLFYPPKPYLEPGIHPTSIVGEGTEIGANVTIGPFTVIGKRCRIGDNTVILAHVDVYNDVRIGRDCLVHSRVCIREQVSLGDRVVLQNGAVLGSDGFGFAKEGERYHKIPQVGTVIVEDDVEIGANTTIDRATLGETRIASGVKLDNLIQIGHNCTVGSNTVIAGQSGLSGSTHVGKGAMIGGQAGFAGHMRVGDGAVVAAKSGVSKSVPDRVMFSGIPARNHRDELHIQASLMRLPGLLKDILFLKKEMTALKKRVEK